MNMIVSASAIAGAARVAMAGDELDPVFAAISEWRCAQEEAREAVDAAEGLEGRLRENDDDDYVAIREHARVLYGWLGNEEDGSRRPWYLFSHKEIDCRVPATPLRARLHAALDRDQAKLEAVQQRNGMGAARAHQTRTSQRELKLLVALCEVVPTSLARHRGLCRGDAR